MDYDDRTQGRALVPYDPDRYRRDRATVARGFWGKLRQAFGKVPFLEDATAAYYCATDPETPSSVKAVLMAALTYFVLPADMIPDFIAGLGFTDDATVFLTALSLVSGHMRARHRQQARRALARLGLRGGSPAKPQDSAP